MFLETPDAGERRPEEFFSRKISVLQKYNIQKFVFIDSPRLLGVLNF